MALDCEGRLWQERLMDLDARLAEAECKKVLDMNKDTFAHRVLAYICEDTCAYRALAYTCAVEDTCAYRALTTICACEDKSAYRVLMYVRVKLHTQNARLRVCIRRLW